MATQNKTDIGLIGLAVMGENLALNMESRGWNVSVYNRTVPGVEEGVVERFINGRAKGKHIEGFTDIEAFVESIALPRKIMMMVRAGSPVDELMEQLFPYLSPGDILIDGGNSNYEDTNRRVKLAESKGFLFVGAGVSGGEEGALNGASIMPGGRRKQGRGETDFAEHCGPSAGWYSVLSVGGTCRIGTFCENDTQRDRVW